MKRGIAVLSCVRTRVDPETDEVRLYVTRPFWRQHRLSTTIGTYFTHETKEPQTTATHKLGASIQQDLPTDPPLMTKVGMPYVGRQGVYEKGEANILFVLEQLKKLQPNADYGHLTLVGHSNGGDTAMYFAKEHPEVVSKVVTLDNLRVPFVLSDKLKILSFRSKDPNFQTDPGVLPPPSQGKDSIDVVHTQFQHTWMSDRGPDSAKEKIQAALDEYLGSGHASDLAPANTDNPIVTNAGAPLP